jgi:molybdate transport system regulatory protein
MTSRSENTLPALVMRLDFSKGHRLGRGKIQLLENIQEHGSISAGGRAMDMSYRRAWMLVDEMNRIFAEPVVVTQRGGNQGGSALVTPFGEELVRRFRAMEEASRAAIRREVEWLTGHLKDETACSEDGAK